MDKYLLAIDQGTSSSRAIIFDRLGKPLSAHQIDLTQSYPHEQWVEQNPNEMFLNTVECCKQSLKKIDLSPKEIAAIGITNQRETTIIWDRKTSQPIYPAIVWQDKRTNDICEKLSSSAEALNISQKTGLRLDPYFSATKIIWLLNNIPGAHQRAEAGELAFGTVDSYLLWCLTKGKIHATDATNASRTLLFNIHTQQWDEEILREFNIPSSLLPQVFDSSADFGKVDAEFLGEPIPIASVIGDQQAATVGQACFQAGMAKSTFGTGCFMVLNTGSKCIESKHHLLSTILYRLKGEVTYGLEGSIFCAGASIKWLRDQLKIITTADETEKLAASISNNGGVYLIPAFNGLGAPHWNAEARGVLAGLTLNTTREHIVRAALESVAYQSADLVNAMANDSQMQISTLRVDGGMTVNNWFLQFLSDILNLEIQKPLYVEATALGAAYLAGLQVKLYDSLDEISQFWQASKNFIPKINNKDRDYLYSDWKKVMLLVAQPTSS